MKISSIIKALQEVKKLDGDLEVLISVDDEGNYYKGISYNEQLHIGFSPPNPNQKPQLVIYAKGKRIYPD